MIFSATIRPGSSIDRMWVGHNRRAGVVHGATFTKRGSVYVADNITPEQFAALQYHPCVRVEVQTVATPQPLNQAWEPPPRQVHAPKHRGKPARR